MSFDTDDPCPPRCLVSSFYYRDLWRQLSKIIDFYLSVQISNEFTGKVNVGAHETNSIVALS